MSTKSSPRLSKFASKFASKFSVGPIWWVSIIVTVLLHSAGAVAVVQAPENGMVDIVGGMLNHLTIRDPIVMEAAPSQTPPTPPPAPLPEEIPVEPEVALARKTNDQPGGNPHVPPSLNPEPVMVAVVPPAVDPPAPKAEKAEKPKKQPKPKPPKAAPKAKAPEPPPADAPKVASAPAAPPSAQTPFDKSTSASPQASSADPAGGPASTIPTSSAGSPSTSASNSAPAPVAATHGLNGGAGSGGTDAIDRKGILKEYLKQVNGAVQKHYEYPRMAMRMRLEGTTLVAVTINAQGDITKVEIAQSSGHSVLDEAALAAVQSLGHVPPPPSALDWSERTVKIPYRFSLRQG